MFNTGFNRVLIFGDNFQFPISQACFKSGLVGNFEQMKVQTHIRPNLLLLFEVEAHLEH